MPLFERADKATKSSYMAVFCCLVGSIVGIGLGYAVSLFTHHGYMPLSTFLVSVFGFLSGYWVLRHRESNFDPSATFVTYILTLSASLWGLRFFFVEPALGPFSVEMWTVPGALTNAAFGIILFLLIGATLGVTYHTARRTYGEFTGRRALCAFVGIGLPLYLLVQTEYFLANFQI